MAGAGRSGARRSRACAAASASSAITISAFVTQARACRAEVIPMLTWSSWPAEDGIESTAAGWARLFDSLTSEAAVYCTIMKPEFTPERSTRKAGSPLLVEGSRSRYRRRSEIDARLTTAAENESSIWATGCPWKFPPETTSPESGRTIGLSVTDEISISDTASACASASRNAPWTWGAHRSEYAS